MNIEEYFDSKQAHELTDLYNRSKFDKELESIYKRIKLAINNGNYCVTLYCTKISDEVLAELKKKGFIINEYRNIDPRDPGYDIKISW